MHAPAFDLVFRAKMTSFAYAFEIWVLVKARLGNEIRVVLIQGDRIMS